MGLAGGAAREGWGSEWMLTGLLGQADPMYLPPFTLIVWPVM